MNESNDKTVLPSYFNRDLSWIEFNRRVLFQSLSPETPFLERIKFLGIVSSNFDEFFMKRVGHLKHTLISSSRRRNGSSPLGALLHTVHKSIHEINQSTENCFEQELLPELKQRNISLVAWSELSSDEKSHLSTYFHERVFPLLIPLAVDLSRPFPFISNLSTSLGVNLQRTGSSDLFFARVKIPEILPYWISIPTQNGFRFLRLPDLVRQHLRRLFPHYKIVDVMPFRITRSAEIETIKEQLNDDEDLMDLVEHELERRRVANVVRLQIPKDFNPEMVTLLKRELDLSSEDVYSFSHQMDWPHLLELYDALPEPHLKFKDWHSTSTPSLKSHPTKSIFKLIQERDHLVHFPYESFQSSVERFVSEAVDDPHVLAIKITLYRIGKDSPLIPLLIRAAEKGKQVVCVIELKARFDEAQNIYWSELLESAGVHVVFGLLGMKVHSKMILVVRDEKRTLQFYGHIGSGNYNARTSNLYTDVSLFTANRKITDEMLDLFNYLTGYSLKLNYHTFLAAPFNMRDKFIQLIEREIDHAKKGKPAQIIAKTNSLEDQQLIDLLYQASQAGVSIDLIVRGFCCLKPGVPGLSEKIKVHSIIGQFLEHSREYFFLNGQSDPLKGSYFIGSADWMQRNLNSRFETIVPIFGKPERIRLWSALNLIINDQRQRWVLDSQGEYSLIHKAGEQGVQSKLMLAALSAKTLPGHGTSSGDRSYESRV